MQVRELFYWLIVIAATSYTISWFDASLVSPRIFFGTFFSGTFAGGCLWMIGHLEHQDMLAAQRRDTY